MQRISVVQENAGVVGELEETSDAALNVRLADGQHVSVSREQLEPLADGTLLLKIPVEELATSESEPARERPVRAAATIAIAGRSTPALGMPAAVPWQEGALANGDSVTVPPVEERPRETLRVHVVPRERRQRVSVPVVETRTEVRRVEVGRIVQEAPEVREEGDTVIIPVVEEVMVIEKRLLLREEIHVVRSRESRQEDHEISLRSERVEITRSKEE